MLTMPTTTRLQVQSDIARGRARTDGLFATILPEALYDRPIPERHRLLFYIGHLDAFDWNYIGKNVLGLGPVSEELDQLFAFGIDPPPGQLPQDAPRDWPSPTHTVDYVRNVRDRLDRELCKAPEHALSVVLEHRLMHAETLTYLIHNLDYERRFTQTPIVVPPLERPTSEFIEVPSGKISLGLCRGESFGWDNEFERHTRELPAFRIGKYKVTNSEYLSFVRAGGPAPHYWTQRGGQWFYRGYHAEVSLPPDFPVYVSNAQAQAFARWAGKDLPTESQFQRAAYGTLFDDQRRYPWGNELPDQHRGNFDFQYSDLVPVTATPFGDSAFGVSQLVGNGWEWTSSPFEPFPGFKQDELYPGYSKPFFDQDHYVVKGASCATDSQLIRPSFRNWYRKQYPYAYTTFRLVEN